MLHAEVEGLDRGWRRDASLSALSWWARFWSVASTMRVRTLGMIRMTRAVTTMAATRSRMLRLKITKPSSPPATMTSDERDLASGNDAIVIPAG